MKHTGRQGNTLLPPGVRPGIGPGKRRFLPPDSPLTGRSVVVSAPPSVPIEALVPLVPAPPPSAPVNPNPRCLTELFNTYKGRTVKLTLAIRAGGESSEKVGALIFANPRYIAIREEGGRNLMVFDISTIKAVNIFDAF
ncbi:MAG TPA: hypothetical protein GXZ65_08515 [Clostridiales bacterium]|jgi:hypothetical protein|nr:hypothetical protein [Clostridiales bacterium]